METLPEPWLRGPVLGVDPLLAPMLYAFQQAREDLAMHTEGLGGEEIWATPLRFWIARFPYPAYRPEYRSARYLLRGTTAFREPVGRTASGEGARSNTGGTASGAGIQFWACCGIG